MNGYPLCRWANLGFFATLILRAPIAADGRESPRGLIPAAKEKTAPFCAAF